MEIVFLISYIIGLVFCLLSTIVAWKNKDSDLWDMLPYAWLGMLLTGWVTGISVLMLMVYVIFIRPRFEK